MKIISGSFVMEIEICISDKIGSDSNKLKAKLFDVLKKNEEQPGKSPHMEHHFEQNARTSAGSHKPFHNDQMAKTADRKKFCNSLYDSKNDCL